MPAANTPCKDIHEHGQVHKLLQESNRRDITDPDLIWTDNLQMLYQIRIARKGMSAVGRSLPFGSTTSLEPTFAHDAFHPFVVDDLSLSAQLVGDPSIAIPGILGCNGFNGLTHLLFVGLRSQMGRGATGHVQDVTHLGDRILLCQHLHHRPFLLGGELKSAEAFFASSSCMVSRPTTRSSSPIRSCSWLCI